MTEPTNPTNETPRFKCGRCGTAEPADNRMTFFELAGLPGSTTQSGLFMPLCTPCLGQAQGKGGADVVAPPLRIVPDTQDRAAEPCSIPAVGRSAAPPLRPFPEVPEDSASQQWEWRLREDVRRGVDSLLALISLRDKP